MFSLNAIFGDAVNESISKSTASIYPLPAYFIYIYIEQEYRLPLSFSWFEFKLNLTHRCECVCVYTCVHIVNFTYSTRLRQFSMCCYFISVKVSCKFLALSSLFGSMLTSACELIYVSLFGFRIPSSKSRVDPLFKGFNNTDYRKY